VTGFGLWEEKKNEGEKRGSVERGQRVIMLEREVDLLCRDLYKANKIK
jgi:hypothetical protein